MKEATADGLKKPLRAKDLMPFRMGEISHNGQRKSIRNENFQEVSEG